MERTANFHDTIADACLPEAAGVVDDAAALDAAVDGLDAHATAGDPTICGFLRAREGPATRLAGRPDDLDLVERKRQEAPILQQAAPGGQGVRGGIGHALIVGAAGRGVTQKENDARSIDQPHVFDRVALVLATITARLLRRILGTPDASLGPIMCKRGAAGEWAGAAAGTSDALGGSCPDTTSALASASVTPRRCASSITDRVGASPSPRSVASRTTNRT
jgi:hypothetical protein